MAFASSPLRRLVLVGLVLAVGGLVWWLLGDRGGMPPAGRPIDRAEPPAAPVEPVESPAAAAVLQGTSDAESPTPAPHAPKPPGDEKPWRLTFGVVDEDGRPRPWSWAEIRDGRGRVRVRQVPLPDSEMRGTLSVPGSGYLVVWSQKHLPWVSDWQEPPASGTRHLEVVVGPGLAVAGEVFEQDGVTPLAAGEVNVWCPASQEPYRPAIGAVKGIVQAGRFRVEGLPAGPVTVQAKCSDRAKGRKVKVETEAGNEALRLVLGPQGFIRFLIVDGATGLAPHTKYAEIRTLEDDGQERAWIVASNTQPGEPGPAKPTGNYFANPGQTYRFRVQAQGYEPSEVIVVTVPETGGELLTRVEVEPDQASVARLTLLVRTADPALPKFVMVTRHRDGSSTGNGMPHEDGRLVVELTPGAHELSVGGGVAAWPGRDFWLPTPLAVELGRGEDREVEVWIELGGWIFIGGDPDPQPREVTLTKDDVTVEKRARWQSWKEESGYFLGVLPAGTWTFTYADRKKGSRGTVEVKKGEVVRLDPATFESFEVEPEPD